MSVYIAKIALEYSDNESWNYSLMVYTLGRNIPLNTISPGRESICVIFLFFHFLSSVWLVCVCVNLCGTDVLT